MEATWSPGIMEPTQESVVSPDSFWPGLQLGRGRPMVGGEVVNLGVVQGG